MSFFSPPSPPPRNARKEDRGKQRAPDRQSSKQARKQTESVRKEQRQKEGSRPANKQADTVQHEHAETMTGHGRTCIHVLRSFWCPGQLRNPSPHTRRRFQSPVVTVDTVLQALCKHLASYLQARVIPLQATLRAYAHTLRFPEVWCFRSPPKCPLYNINKGTASELVGARPGSSHAGLTEAASRILPRPLPALSRPGGALLSQILVWSCIFRRLSGIFVPKRPINECLLPLEPVCSV